MSILSKKINGSVSRTAAQIGAEIPAAQRSLQDLESERKALALAAQEGGSDKDLRDIDERIRGQRVHVKNLRDARDASLARERDLESQAVRAAAERQRGEARKHNNFRAQHAQNIERGAELVARGWRGMLAAGAAMTEAVPGMRLDGAMVGPAEVVRAIAVEFWRVSGPTGLNGVALPGANPFSISERNPAAIAPFTEKVREAQAHADGLLSSKAAHAPSAAAEVAA